MASSNNGMRGSPAIKRQIPSNVVVGQPCWQCGNNCIGGYMPHVWRKKCMNCGCARHCHQEFSHYTELSYLSSLDFKDVLSAENKARLDLKYSWYPRGVEYDIVEKYLSSLPEDCIPYKKSLKKRHEMFSSQHPYQDGNLKYCQDLPDIEQKRMVKFGERRLRKNFGVAELSLLTASKANVCHECSTTIKEGSVVVTAPERIPTGKRWHSECFRCHSCAELLVDLLYFYSPDNDEVYCGKHHAETIVHRCNGCEELIVSGTYTEAKGKWHKNHFTCSKCDQELHDKEYRNIDDGTLFCKSCFTKYLAEQCVKCKTAITIGQTKVTVDGKTMHKECFTCKRCQVFLSGSKYFKHGDSFLCEDCQAREIVAQCHGCKEGIKSTTSFVKHKTFAWHPNCFKCGICQAWLANGEFQDIDDSIMCKDCFQQKNSRKCCRCQKSILNKNVQLGLDYYHPDCFTCLECDKSLLEEEKVSSSDVICSHCKVKKAKICIYCKCPITTRHTVYKGHPFHLDCFKCNLCGSSIQGSEFYETSLNEILCSKCGSLRP